MAARPSRVFLDKIIQFSNLRSDILNWEGTFRTNFLIEEFLVEQYVLFYSLNHLTYLAAYMGTANITDLAIRGGKVFDLGDAANEEESAVGIVREYGTR